MKFLEAIKKNILDQNPVLVRFFGLLPALAVTNDMKKAIFMGVFVMGVIIMTGLVVPVTERFFDKSIREISVVVIVSAIVTVLRFVFKAFYPSPDMALGIFVPIIAVDSIVLMPVLGERKKKYPVAVAESIGTGIGFFFAATLLGTVREILGAGTVLGGTRFEKTVPYFEPIRIFVLPAGGFITLALLSALFIFLLKKFGVGKEKKTK